MKIEIWSDVVCPFCYLGKRRLEKAIERLDFKSNIQIEWHSFQLNPDAEYDPSTDLYTHLATMKGQTREWSIAIHENLAATAAEEGLDYRFDQAKLCNTFDAHRLIQLAKRHGLDNQIEERLFKAYFSEGALISDHALLIQLAEEEGMNQVEVRNMLESEEYTPDVQRDIQTANTIGVNGVPFFVIDRKYAISGAQATDHFVNALKGIYEEGQAALK